MLLARPRPVRPSLARRRAGRPAPARAALAFVPVGDGSTDHLDGAPAAHAPAPALPPPGAPAVDVGREPPADIVLALPTVSARHATLAVTEEGGAALLTDVGSTNGSYVDGEPLEAGVETVVRPGSVVVFGDQYLAAYRLEEA